MYDDNLNAPPLNPLPWVVVLLSCLVGGVELIFQAAEAGFIGGPEGIGWRLWAVQNYAFSDNIFDWMRLTGQHPVQHIVRFFSYTFIHQTMTHAIFAVVFILALGKFVAEVLHPVAVLVIFFASGAIGAAAYSVFLDEQFAMIGAYPAIYGLIGAFTWLRFTTLQDEGENGLRAFNLIIFFMAIALIYKFLFGGSNDWLAELVGFCVGFGLGVVLGPDGKLRLQMLLAQFRRR
jgi:membrane associated rhomboid family serine protease